MNLVSDRKKYVLERLSSMSGKYSELARKSGCDSSTLAKIAKRTEELGPDAVDMRVSILISLDNYFSESGVECNANEAA